MDIKHIEGYNSVVIKKIRTPLVYFYAKAFASVVALFGFDSTQFSLKPTKAFNIMFNKKRLKGPKMLKKMHQ